MLASVTISTWQARCFDEKATEEVEKSHETKGIGRFNKGKSFCPSTSLA
jgi:hypothetical protein